MVTEITTQMVAVFPTVRCSKCDRETNDVITFVSPTNEIAYVCWSCQEREEKGFNTKADFHRMRRPLRHGR